MQTELKIQGSGRKLTFSLGWSGIDQQVTTATFVASAMAQHPVL